MILKNRENTDPTLYFFKLIPLKLILFIFIGMLTLDSCSVENPGPIPSEKLNTKEAMPPLVAGMAGLYAQASGDVSFFTAVASNDITYSGAFNEGIRMQKGDIRPLDVGNTQRGDVWANINAARVAAEDGIKRMKKVLGNDFDSNLLAIKAYTWDGFANRTLGEDFCQAIFDGGAPKSNMEYFKRAEKDFTKAIKLAKKQDEKDLLDRSYAGRAQVRLALQNWKGAASDSKKVSKDFVLNAAHSSASFDRSNYFAYQTINRLYMSVYGTFAAKIKDDPRIKWEDINSKGNDGETPQYNQLKYADEESSIEIAKWDEMYLIRSEIALRDHNKDKAMGLINDVRSRYDLNDQSASDEDEAWDILRKERSIILWMEGRRLWDLRRFDDPFLEGRDKCMTPSLQEIQSNENISLSDYQ